MSDETEVKVEQTPVETPKSPSKIWEIMTWVCVLVLVGFVVLTIVNTQDWKIFHDAPIMHYVAWLISEGMIPYRDIFDMNMPGTYLIHYLVLTGLGNDDLSWRVFDLAWLGITYALIVLYCKRQGLLAGVTAATLFACFHLAAGNLMSGQRDFLLAPFILLGGHMVANITENKQRILSALFAGILFGIAFWIKPYIALLFIALFLYAKIKSHSIFVSLLMLFGFLLPASGVLSYLYFNQALLPWWEIVSQYLIPIYSTLGPNLDAQDMIYDVLSSLAILLPFLALSTPLTGRFFVSLIGVVYGVLHFTMQKKGFTYHLSPLFLWVSIFTAYRIGSNLKAPRTAPRFTAFIGVMTVCILASPLYFLEESKLKPTSPADDKSQLIYNDLKDLVKHGDSVQVMDHTSGGIHAMLKLKLKPATRFLRDFQFFASADHYYVQSLEDEFVKSLATAPPKVILITDQSWPDAKIGFNRISDSPALVKILKTKYSLEVDAPTHKIYLKLPTTQLKP